jgi:hypothetical protein
MRTRIYLTKRRKKEKRAFTPSPRLKIYCPYTYRDL